MEGLRLRGNVRQMSQEGFSASAAVSLYDSAMGIMCAAPALSRRPAYCYNCTCSRTDSFAARDRRDQKVESGWKKAGTCEKIIG